MARHMAGNHISPGHMSYVTCHMPCQLSFPNGCVLSVRQEQTTITTLKLSNQIKHVSLGETAPLHFAWQRDVAPFAIIANQESISSWESCQLKSMCTAKICMYVGQSWVLIRRLQPRKAPHRTNSSQTYPSIMKLRQQGHLSNFHRSWRQLMRTPQT